MTLTGELHGHQQRDRERGKGDRDWLDQYGRMEPDGQHLSLVRQEMPFDCVWHPVEVGCHPDAHVYLIWRRRNSRVPWPGW